VSETNDPLDAFEALVINASDDFSTYRADNNFKVLALEDGWEIDLLVASLVLGDTLDDMIISIPGQADLSFEDWAKSPKPPKLWAFRGRLLGKNSPHNKLPMPCFDFVKEIWGDAAAWNTAVSTAVSKAPQNKDQIELLTAQYNQRVTRAHTVFILPRSSAWQPTQPRLGEVWSVRLREGKENRYDHAYGTAIKNESPDTGANFIKIENWKKSNSTTDIYYTPAKEGCDSLLELFEEEYIPTLPIINLEEGECEIVDGDWPSWTKYRSNYMWTQLPPGMPHALTVKPCENYVVVGKNYPALKDIVKKEIDWWACGDVKKAWESKMDSATLAEFNTEPTVDGVTGWYVDNATKCTYRMLGARNERAQVLDPETGKIKVSYLSARAGTKQKYRGDTDELGTGTAEFEKIKEYYTVAYKKSSGKPLPTTGMFEPETWVNAGTAWSAVTISWLLLQVDKDFPSGTGHFKYMFRSHGVEPTYISASKPYKFPSNTSKKGDWTIWLRGKTATRIMAQIGDILVRPRGGTSQMHGDVVSRIAKDGDKTYAYLAGGNISNTMYGWVKDMRIELTSAGTYSPASSGTDYQIVLKKNGVIVEDTTALVAQVKDKPDEIVVA